MAKNDFNVEEPNYNVDPNVGVDNFGNSIVNENYNTTSNVNNIQSASNMNNYNTNGLPNMGNVNYYSNNANNVNSSNFVNPNANGVNGNYSQNQNNNFNNADVVFEDHFDLTPEEKIKEFINGINKKMLMFVGGIIAAILLIVIIIVVIVSRVNASYKAKVIIPDIVYMGETANISVQAQGKKDINLTKTKFSVSTVAPTKEDSKKKIKPRQAFYVLDEELKGQSVTNTIIPIQEGVSTINVVSTLGKRKLANEKKDVVVCPAFNANLLMFKDLYLVKDAKYSLNIDFGNELCSEGIQYESSNSDIFTVDEEGQITPIKIGTAILSIKKDDMSIDAKVAVTDKNIDVKALKVVPSKLQLAAGENVRLMLDHAPANATSGRIAFKSSDETVALVSEGGLIQAIAAGTAKITVLAPSGVKAEVTVIVTGGSEESDSAVPTEINLQKTEINLVQGNSERIIAIVTPDVAKNKKLTWKSVDENIATVDQNGVVLARNEGSTNVTVATFNDIIKTIKVNVTKMKSPVITASDKINTNHWHTKPYTLNFSGAANGLFYYYGTSEDNMTNTGNKLTISKDSNLIYYVKICTVSCQAKCQEKRVKRDVIKTCEKDCNPEPVICSSPTAYVSKLDTTKPEVLKIVGVETTRAVKDDTVQIAFKDATSMIKYWCVTNVDSASTCKWKTIQSSSSPVENYTATYNDIYYVFAKDAAGNISDSRQFEITNIE